MTFVLDWAQLAELQQYRQEAKEAFRKEQPTLAPSLAGTALSDGGRQKILDMMETFYQEMEKAAERMPEEFDYSLSPDVLGKMDSSAIGYLFFDNFRPKVPWTFSAKKRAARAQYNEIMDARAWSAVLYLKRARAYLPSAERGGKH